MTEEKRRKKKPAKKKKPTEQEKNGLFRFGNKKAPGSDSKPKKNKDEKQEKEETVAGNGQVLQSKGALLGRIAAWAFVAFVGVGALAAVLNLVNPPATAEQIVEAGETPESQQAAEYGRGFVGTWLRATGDDDQEVARYMPISRGDITEDEPTEFRELSVASVETTDNGISTVIISAEVYTVIDEDEHENEITSTDDLTNEDEETSEDDEESTEDDEEEASEEENADPDGDEDPETAWVPTWYQVNVFYDGETFTPLGWPAPVPAPETGDGPRLAYNFAGSDEIESTIEDFFEAYILESGDVTRMTHPDSTIQSLGTNPYTSVEIGNITTDEDHRDEVPDDGTTTHSLVNLSLGTTEDTARAATYALTLETRGGRWEVLTLDPAPVLHPEVTTEREAEPTDTVTDEPTDTDQISEGTEGPTE